MASRKKELLAIAGREVSISNPDKLYFREAGITKLDLVRYYLAVADGALRGVRDRPMALKRYVDGAEGEFFFQKRAPASRPPWVDVVELRFPSGRSAQEIVVRDAAQLAWVVNLGCIDLNPHPVRASDLEHPDELRVDLDPVPGVGWDAIRRVAAEVREALAEHRLVGWPKTSGSRGIHVYARIEPRWTFTEVRAAALALARDRRHLAHRLEPDARAGVEVHAQLVRVLEVARADRVRVEVDAAEVHHPREVRRLVADDEVGAPAAGEGDQRRLDPRRAARRRALLEERLSLDTVHVPLQRHRPAAHAAQRPIGNRDVVADEVELREARAREVDLFRVGDRHVAAADLERDPVRLRCHPAPLLRTTQRGSARPVVDPWSSH